MTAPELLRLIYEQEMQRQRENDLHPTLLYRKDTRGKKTRMKKIRIEMEHRLLQEWYDFHSHIKHTGYRDFYSKILFCLDEELVSHLDADAFLDLLADRRFLFLHNNENYSMPEYPPLSDIVHAPRTYLDPPSPDEEPETEIKKKHRQNAETVFQQIFVPTSGHQSAWEEWTAHRRELQNAYTLEKMLAEECDSKAETLEIQITPALQMPLTKREEKLCELFRKYVEVCHEHAYAEDMKEDLDRRKYQGIIQYVDHYLRTKYPKDKIFQAIVFFHLFSQQMKRVARGSLRKYCCKPLQPSKLKNQRPIAVQSTVRTRIECNIKMFDYLMEILLFDGDSTRSRKARAQEYGTLEDAVEIKEIPLLTRAKYRFRLFTRYDQYCHYDLRKKYKYDETTKGVELQIDFYCRENLQDGVDLFGNLLRYHIKYCMPNQSHWLLPFILQLDFSPILATLLLDDGQILPTRERLPDRIRLAVSDRKKPSYMVERYEEHLLDQKQLRDDLEEWCEEFGFHFRHEDALYERDFKQDSPESKAAAQCGRVVLDYVLREELIHRAETNLLKKAKDLFGEILDQQEPEEENENA